MVKENHKMLPVIVGTEKEVLGGLVWGFFLLSLCFQTTTTCLEDAVYPGKEVGQAEFSREMVSCTVSMFCEGYCCEHPVYPVWKCLNRKNSDPPSSWCPLEAGITRPFSPGRTLANVWVKDKKQWVQRYLKGNGKNQKFNQFWCLWFLGREERKRALFCFSSEIAKSFKRAQKKNRV